MEKRYDAIIIGAGHNGLIAATYLGKKGKKVVVLEKNTFPGGLATRTEFHTGYRSTGILQDSSLLDYKVVQDLGLESKGLVIQNQRPEIMLLGRNHDEILLEQDAEKSVAAIARHSKKDAQRYRDYLQFIQDISPFIQSVFSNMPPDLSGFAPGQVMKLGQLGWKLRRLGKATMLQLLKVAPMCVSDFLDEYFETDLLKSGLSFPALLGSFTSPRSAYTTLNLLMWDCRSKCYLPGGPAALIDSLLKAAESLGVEVKMDSEVKSIHFDDKNCVEGIALENGDTYLSPIVLSSATPRHTFFDLVPNYQLSFELEHDVKNYRSRGMTAKMNLALDRIPGQVKASIIRLGADWATMELAFDPSKYRQIPEEPTLELSIPSLGDPQLAPEGHAVLSILAHHIPYNLEGGWTDAAKTTLSQAILSALDSYLPGISETIVGSEIITPQDLENNYGLTEGQIFHGEHAIDQILARPIPSCARYATPLAGLFLCGSGTFPGGGITGAPGRLAIEAIR